MDLVELESGAPVRRHPWEEARLAFFLRVLRGAGLLRSRVAVLDVGAGDGFIARRLAEELAPGSTVTCWDANYTAAHLASPAFAPTGRLHFTRAAPADAFGLALLLDVLEHVADDLGFLSEVVARRLLPGAHALVSVPAWPALSSSHDEGLRHHRRYAPGAARALLAGAGLEVVRGGGLFHALIPPRAAQVALERLRHRPRPPAELGGWSAPAPVTALVRGALSLDASLSLLLSRLGIDLPGLSWWALCRKR
ncbi:bifunctional 2-polyprenyl-6-hydroxyphenol methylase/3-demethylubiquinol 3-O-methyltransferase UbiG [Anaeromyxobacter sp. Fw109-5]|uniref:class I SAM-dependent methyltransferase n=1 Tax=Anaeromyxobacter sp. (strain Fw109-5) TaxID=404589 RepID=UPI00030741A9|nr:methyltransferase domain-containing protein [Anaeromyxobacter sp. Fw109-5]